MLKLKSKMIMILCSISLICTNCNPILCSASILVWMEPSCPTSLSSSDSTSVCSDQNTKHVTGPLVKLQKKILTFDQLRSEGSTL